MLDTLKNKYQIVPGPNGVLEIANAGRSEMAKWLGTWAKTGAEIGVAHAHYSLELMAANPELKLYGIDPYEVYAGYKDYALKRTMATLKADAYIRMDGFPNYEFVHKYSVEAAKDFPDDSLDFVYIDANHMEPYVTQDLEAWMPKVKKGGVVAGHDYALLRHERYDVMDAIHGYVKKHDIQLYIWGLNSKADPSLVRDNIRSWMWIK